MSQQSEERLPESASDAASTPTTARILHLKSRHSDLQQAILQRAQQSVERERDLDQEERRPKPLKWLIIASIAAIPVVLTFTAVDGFLRAFYGYLDVAIATQPQGEPAPAEASLQSSQPGVVMVQPVTSDAPVPATAPQATTTDSAKTPEN